MKDKLIKWIEKKNIRLNYKKYLIVAYVVLVMVPIMLYLGFKDMGVDNVVVKSVANILLLVLFVVFFVFDFRKKTAEDWGLVTMQVDDDCLKTLKSDIGSARSIRMVLTENCAEICDMIENTEYREKCRYDILMLNPYCDYAKFMDEDLVFYSEKLETIAAQGKCDINIKYYSCPPIDNFVLLNENAVYIYPMTQRLNDGRRMCKSFMGNKKGCKMYADIFERLWREPVYNGGAK